MKKSILLLIITGITTTSMAQYHFNDSIARSRAQISKNAMLTLGGWAAANIASGFIIASQTEGEAKYFWRMNGYWNIINLGIAGMGYAGARKALRKTSDFADNVRGQNSVEKLYLLNLGLDMAYMAGGLYLSERGSTRTNPKTRDQLRGYGKSIILQGGFLLIYDGILYLLHHRNTLRVNDKLNQPEIQAGPGMISMRYTF